MNRHPAESLEDSAPKSISDTKNCLNWNGNLDNPNEREDECEADDESYMEPCCGIEASKTTDHCVVSAAPNVTGLIQPTLKSMKQGNKGLVTVSTMETRRNKGNKKN